MKSNKNKIETPFADAFKSAYEEYHALIREVISLLRNSNVQSWVYVSGRQITSMSGTIPDEEPFVSWCHEPSISIGDNAIHSVVVSWTNSNIAFLLPVGNTRIGEDVNHIHHKRIDLWLSSLVDGMNIGIFVDKKS